MTKIDKKGPLGWFAAAREAFVRVKDGIGKAADYAFATGQVDMALGLANIGFGAMDHKNTLVYLGTGLTVIGINRFGRSLVREMRGGGSTPTPAPC